MLNVQRIAKNNGFHSTNLSTAIEEAIASLRLEGIVLSDEAIADLELFTQGRLVEEEVIQRALERVREQTKYRDF